MHSPRSSHLALCLTSFALCLSCGSEPAQSDEITTDVATDPTGTSTAASTTNTGAAVPSSAPSTSTQASTTSTAQVATATQNTAGSGPTSAPPPSSLPMPPTTPNTAGTAPVVPTAQPTAQPTAGNTTPAPTDTGVTPPEPTDQGTGGVGTPPEETAEPAPDVDANGKLSAVPGTTTDVAQDYIRLGDVRILNNNWGSEDLGCTAPNSTMSVFANQDGTFGWNFNRGDCAQMTDTSHPDFPQLEFGIHPFGIGSDLATSPEFTSTALLPIQLSELKSASVTLDQLTINLQNQSSWNVAMEFWLSERNPLEPNPGVYAELMTWWGWDNGRWPCDLNGDGKVDYGDNVSAGTMSYTLCHQSDNWADGWRYYQFRAGDGSDNNIKRDFNGKVDVKALVDYLVNQRGYPTTLWLTRMEVGSEIDDTTSGTVSMHGVTFEVNGESRSQVMGTP